MRVTSLRRFERKQFEQSPVCGGKERNGNQFRRLTIMKDLGYRKNESGHLEKDEEEERDANVAKATRLRDDEGRREKLLCRTLSTYPAHCLRCSDKHPPVLILNPQLCRGDPRT